ncbi:methylglyoxal synthase [Roseomonas hellenica]|uniref:Methylglyoxal synthase n=1 Tax=Plastoroseomonas hellenica TaxID=2687306 RepID=A0ABS5EW29_9PROT|nr:methylglyoxal synthase [Plastoroseomonas hellenica]MBR0664433.1 methylglyoxal synthase [Plastoroseomonas hellenica]
MHPPLRIGLVAHDAKKAELIAWAQRWEDWLARHSLVGTGTSADDIEQACPSLRVEHLRSGPDGGDMQLGAWIVDGGIDALVFLLDPASAHAHEADFRALIRVALIAGIPVALSEASAEHLAIGMSLPAPAVAEPEFREIYSSSNGDHWRLGIVRGRMFVRHQPNAASGGTTTDTDVEQFLSSGTGPEHQALRRMIEQRRRGTEAP